MSQFIGHVRTVLRKAQSLDRLWEETVNRGAQLEALAVELRGIATNADPEQAQLVEQICNHLHSAMSHSQFLAVLIPLERAYAKGVADPDFLPLEGDRQLGSLDGSSAPPVAVVLDSLRSAYNVGAIVRSCECFAVQRILTCGYTTKLSSPGVIKTAMGTHSQFQEEEVRSTLTALQQLRKSGYQIFALEHTKLSQSLYETRFDDSNTAFLLGNERHGIAAPLLQECDKIIHIPMLGTKNSLNVGIACGIALAEYRRQRAGPGVDQAKT